MADNTNNEYHFDVSAAVIRQLGEELVTDEVTAIMELIKNSYDADADWVSVDINLKDYYPDSKKYYKDSSPGYIAIQDNGFGMSIDDIRNSWMRISLSKKKKFKEEGKETTKGRTPLGEKGVGRLSTQRLGARLELFTGKEKSEKQIHVAFDWNQFKENTSLRSVPVHVDDFTKPTTAKGTTLVITNLKEPKKWEKGAWDSFRGQISQMVFPFKENRAFNVYLKLNGQSVDLDELNKKVINNSVSNYAFLVEGEKITLDGSIKLQKLSGSNKKDDILFYENNILPDFGADFFSFLTDKEENKRNFLSNISHSNKQGIFFTFHREINIKDLPGLAFLVNEDLRKEGSETDADSIVNTDSETEEDDNNLRIEIAHPGDFEGEIHDFYFKDSQNIENAFDSLSEFKRLVQNQVGIRIFRDGFGIKPYGINGQDWLKLSGNQTSGTSFYGLRPANIVGYVTISAKHNKYLKEKTDREGFMDSPYSRNFLRIMDYFVNEINSVLESTRRSYNDYKAKLGQESAGIQDITDSFNKLKRTSQKANKSSNRAEEVRLNLLRIADDVSRASIGRVDDKNDEIKSLLTSLSKMLKEAQQLLIEVEDILRDARDLDQHVNFLQPQIINLEQQLSDFSELAGLGLTAEALSHELSNIIDRMGDETNRITQRLKSKEIDKSQFRIYVESVKASMRSFRKQLSHLAPSLKYVKETKDLINIDDYLTETKSFYSDRFGKEIEIVTEISGAKFSLRMNKGKLTQAFDNIILNSEYWLRERKKAEPSFSPIITIEAQEPFIRIFDNGLGIEPNIQDRIFQPFITAKPKNQGRGLGLFIVQQLLESSGCDLMLLNSKNEFGRRFIFQLNMSNVIEI